MSQQQQNQPYTNRFATYTDRVYQNVEAQPSFVGQLATVRSIASTNEGHKLNMSHRVGDVTYTVVVELIDHRMKGQLRRITCMGSLAEEVAEMKLSKGDVISFDGKYNEGASMLQDGRLAKRPYIIASWFELKLKVAPKEGLSEVSEVGHVTPLPGEYIHKEAEGQNQAA